jgi:hypothetical protein
MPETFPVLDPDTGTLTDVEHFSITEVAEMLHISRTTAYKAMAEDHWPHMTIVKRVWMSGADVAAVVAGMRRNDAAIPEAEHGVRLGLVIPGEADETHGDQDPGGVR